MHTSRLLATERFAVWFVFARLWGAAAATFTSDTTIPAGDTSYDNLDLTVVGCRLTVAGDHVFGQVEVQAGATFVFAGTNLAASALAARQATTIELAGAAWARISGALTVVSNSTVRCLGRNTSAQVQGAWKGMGIRLETQTVEVDSTSSITADGQGYTCPGANQDGNGPGGGRRGWWGGPNASGGGHGGQGGVGDRGGFTNPSGMTHGSSIEPTDPGSAGGGVDGVGAPGGGAIRLEVAEALTLDGVISANGASAGGWAGGGAGGSIWIVTRLLAGSGSLHAHGGDGSGSGSGGGGRIAVYCATNQFAGLANCEVRGGIANPAGQEGTIAFFDTKIPQLHLEVFDHFVLTADSRHAFGAITVAEGGRLVVGNNAVVEVATLLSVTNGSTLTLGGGAHLRVAQAFEVLDSSAVLVESVNKTGRSDHVWMGTGATIDAGSARVDTTSRLSADAQGYRAALNRAGAGPGGGAPGWWGPRQSGGSSGGAYGGSGGAGRDNLPSRGYGLAELPLDLGSAGGTFESVPGGHGGGWLELRIEEDLEIEGVVSANGGDGGAEGGGAGGGVLISTRLLKGMGGIRVDGGSATGIAGGGGGGRVAVYCWGGNLMPFDHITAAGGAGYTSGTDGSIVIRSQPYSRWMSPNHSLFHGTEPIGWSVAGVSARHHRARIEAVHDAETILIGDNLPVSGTVNWETTAVANGQYVLRLTLFEDGGGQVGELTRNVLVNNGVTWHGGVVAASETWPAGSVHVVSGPLRILAGVTVTLAPGAVVKFDEGAELEIETGGTLAAAGLAGQLVVLTSLADDTVGGDTNLDADDTMGRRGEWTLRLDPGAQFLHNEFTELAFARVTHAGAVAADETWDGRLLHLVLDDVTVSAGAKLAIEAGAIVKFELMKGLVVGSGATLDIAGTVAEPVVFTSIRDDLHGGDDNEDADETTPDAGDWRWLFIDGGEAVIEHAVMLYGGGTPSGTYEAAGILRVAGNAAVNVRNSVLREAPFEAVKTEGGQTTLTGCVIASADRGVTVDGASALHLVHCTFDNHGTGLWGHGGSWDGTNCIFSRNRVAGIDTHLSPNWTLRYCNVWSASGEDFIGGDNPIGRDGNLSVDPCMKEPDKGDYRLRHLSPVIDAADGQAATLTDLTGATRYDDPRMPNTGTATPDAAFADMGACEFVETAESQMDLVVRDVTGPTAAEAGTWATLSWRVLNAGAGSYAGAWHDQVWLTPASDGLGESSLAAEVLSQGNLGPNQAVTRTAVVRVPGGLEGSWRWQVRANVQGEVFEGRNWTNNTADALLATALTVPELTVGGPSLTGRFSAAAEPHWFKFIPASQHDVTVGLDLATPDGATELYIARGYMPTRLLFDSRSLDVNSADSSALAAAPAPSVYYVLAIACSLPNGAQDFAIMAEVAGFGIKQVTPSVIGNAGPATLEVHGSQLSPAVAVALVGQDGAAHPAAAVAWTNSTLVHATFDATSLSQGVYDLRVSDGGLTATLPGSVSVQTGFGSHLWVDIVGKDVLRVKTSASYEVFYGNNGGNDIDGALLFLSGFSAFNDVMAGPQFRPDPVPEGLVGSSATTVEFGNWIALTPLTLPALRPGQSGKATFGFVAGDVSNDSFVEVGALVPNAGACCANLAESGGGVHWERTLPPGAVPPPLRGGSVRLAGVFPGIPDQDRAALNEALRVAWVYYPFDFAPMRWKQGHACYEAALHLQEQLYYTADAPGNPLVNWRITVITKNLAGGHTSVLLTSPDGSRVYMVDNFLYPGVIPMVKVGADKWQIDPRWYLTHPSTIIGVIDTVFMGGYLNPWVPLGGIKVKCAVPYTGLGKKTIRVVGSADPNDKSGLTGSGSPRWIAGSETLAYTIDFENVPTATAPAQQVVVTDSLSPLIDWRTVELGDIRFNDLEMTIDSGLRHFESTTRVATDPHPVRVTADFSPHNGMLSWRVVSVDPVTGSVPDDPFAGFLPPNKADGVGQGSVRFSARLRPGLAHGTTITNAASIVFDVNAPILTPLYVNTIDALPPASAVNALPAQAWSDFVVTWSGQDEGSGVAGYDIYVARDGGAYELWLSQTSDTSALFSGQLGSSYAFYSVAADGVGRRESVPLVPDAVTRIEWAAPEAEALWLGDRLELRWTSSPGVTYHVERTSALGADAAWATIATVPASGSSASWIDTDLATRRFYRLRVDN